MPHDAPVRAGDPTSDIQEWRRIESSMTAARWFAVAFAVFQVAAYDAPGAPAHVEPTGFALAGLLAAASVLFWSVSRRVGTIPAAHRLAWASLLFDAGLISAFVWLYAFDQTSSMYLLFFVLPAEAALKFRTVGALAAWAACTALYVARELWASGRYGHEVELTSITFRMGILLLVSIILGVFASKLAERTRELAAALEDLEEQERWRQALIDMLAHDLRGPVSGATSTMVVLRDRLDRLRPQQIRDLAAGAVRQNERALRLTQDLLDLARSEQGRLELHRREVELAPLLRRVVDSTVGPDRVAVSAGETDVAVVDPARLEQIVANLVANAVKHGALPVEVTATCRDGGLELRVTDSGQGVPPELEPVLFQAFGAGPSEGSTGLGLWIVRTLVEAHGGTVAYDGSGGRPSFVVHLPVSAPDPAPEPVDA